MRYTQDVFDKSKRILSPVPYRNMALENFCWIAYIRNDSGFHKLTQDMALYWNIVWVSNTLLRIIYWHTPFTLIHLGHRDARHMMTYILVDIGSDEGPFADGTKPLPEPMPTYHQRCTLVFTWQ